MPSAGSIRSTSHLRKSQAIPRERGRHRRKRGRNGGLHFLAQLIVHAAIQDIRERLSVFAFILDVRHRAAAGDRLTLVLQRHAARRAGLDNRRTRDSGSRVAGRPSRRLRASRSAWTARFSISGQDAAICASSSVSARVIDSEIGDRAAVEVLLSSVPAHVQRRIGSEVTPDLFTSIGAAFERCRLAIDEQRQS